MSYAMLLRRDGSVWFVALEPARLSPELRFRGRRFVRVGMAVMPSVRAPRVDVYEEEETGLDKSSGKV